MKRQYLLNELAREYHKRTEEFDRSVCTGPIVRGSIMPSTPDQHRAITRNALAVKDELGSEAAKLGFSPKEWQAAISEASRSIA